MVPGPVRRRMPIEDRKRGTGEEEKRRAVSLVLVRLIDSGNEQGGPSYAGMAGGRTDIEGIGKNRLRATNSGNEKTSDVAGGEKIRTTASDVREIVGSSPSQHAVLSLLSKFAPTDSTVSRSTGDKRGERGKSCFSAAAAVTNGSHVSFRERLSGVNCAAFSARLHA